MYRCELRELGPIGYAEAFELQRQLVERRKKGQISNQLLFVEHPHVITLGRNSHLSNVLASPETLARAGVVLEETNRGGDVTYHGPGQIIGYPILDLRDWKRDVVAYVRALEQAIIDALAPWGIPGVREQGMTGVWVNGAKIAAIGVHISRWITSHGFALNVSTDLSYFRYIVPCGLSKPVTSLRELGCEAPESAVKAAVAGKLAKQFDLDLAEADALPGNSAVHEDLALTMEGKR